MNQFHFLRPIWFALSPLLVILLWVYHRRKAVSRSWRAVCDPALLPHLLIGNTEGRKDRNALYFMGIGGILALSALAGPAWKQLEQPVFRDQSALVLVLDLSRSMDATDIKPTRLTRARHKLIDILKKREEGLTALIVYAAESFVVSPLTQDAETIIAQVAALKTTLMPRQGSRPDLALQKAGALFQQAGTPRGRVLLITDGLENVPQKKLDETTDALKESGHALSVLGVGSAEGAPISLAKGGFLKDRQGRIVIPKLNAGGLARLARRGGGKYQTLSVDERDIEEILADNLSSRLENQSEETGLKTDRWREEGPWLLLPLLFFTALAFRRGVIAMILFSCLLLPRPAHAIDWESLWSRQDQRAAAAFSAGDKEGAAALFENREWKAASQYRAGQYQESIKTLEGLEDPDTFYNKGNALAELGRLPEAIQAYDEALKRDPKHEDARYNREAVQEKLDQQEQNQEDSKDNQNGEPSEQSENGDSSEASDEDRGQPDGEDGDDSLPDQDKTDQAKKDQADDAENSQEAGDKQEAEENQAAREPEKQRPDEPESPNESESDADQRLAQSEMRESDESRQATEQWLRRIPDDPGGLLRRKFLYQSKQSRLGGQQNMTGEEAAW